MHRSTKVEVLCHGNERVGQGESLLITVIKHQHTQHTSAHKSGNLQQSCPTLTHTIMSSQTHDDKFVWFGKIGCCAANAPSLLIWAVFMNLVGLASVAIASFSIMQVVLKTSDLERF